MDALAQGDALALLDAIFANAPVGLAFWTPELRFERVNPALAQMNGRSVEEHAGRSVEDVLGVEAGRVRAHLEEVIRLGRPVVDQEIAGTPGRARVAWWEASYFPVFEDDGTLLGVGGVVRDVTDRHLAEAERAQLLKEALSARALADAARLRAEAAKADAEEARARTSFLATAGASMAASLDYEATLQAVARSAVPEMGELCAIAVAGPTGSLATVAVAHEDAATEGDALALLEAAPVWEATDAPEVRELDGRWGELGLRSALVVPLRTVRRVVGALALLRSPGRRGFDEEDVALARALAARAALHVENARLYRERSKIAATLQAGLLPAALPHVPGVEIGVRYRAAGDQNEVGGDFYDVWDAGGGEWVALVGDVSGKGAEAAAITALTRHTLYAASLRGDRPPAALALLNDALRIRGGGSAVFATLVFACLCPGRDGVTIHLANAGHPPPLVRRVDGRIEAIGTTGPLVGILKNAEYGTHPLVLASGELLLLYTDGVTELRGRDPLYGERRLREVLSSHPDAGSDDILDLVERGAVEAQDGDPRDDIALLALRAR